MYSVVEIKDGNYAEELACTYTLQDAREYQRLAIVEADILQLTNTEDLYGIETDNLVWIPVQ